MWEFIGGILLGVGIASAVLGNILLTKNSAITNLKLKNDTLSHLLRLEGKMRRKQGK